MTKREELPLPDYEHLPLETLRHRIRMLDADGVQKLLDYERAHGNRLPVVQVMKSWLEELREGAQPSDGHPFELKPEAPPPPVRPPMRGRPTAPARPFTPPPG